ncbi:TPM domain-containing protein [Sulfuritalea sp.]|uniref:TPM domain-containing protein n=1 Tax=Sulfuritalea sp. TaxID=2480090 RepID=UPI001AC73FE9|nr:TPM domain-containing protein [Sulfuritalea sp.]MBN8477323.1 TPM domain-containing protein [Sulfuritalea sp.]
MKLLRALRHLLLPDWWTQRVFTRADLAAIGAAITAGEKTHRGELRVVVEGSLPLGSLWRDQSSRERAVELFARQRVWDTEENSGILIYVQLLDRRVDILADRGIAARVPQAEWDAICREMENSFRGGGWRSGALRAVARATGLLTQHFPAGNSNPNELPDQPLVL